MIAALFVIIQFLSLINRTEDMLCWICEKHTHTNDRLFCAIMGRRKMTHFVIQLCLLYSRLEWYGRVVHWRFAVDSGFVVYQTI